MTTTTSSIPAALQRLRATFATGKTHAIDGACTSRRARADDARHEADFAEALKADLGKCRFEAVLTEMSFVESEATTPASTCGAGSSRRACRRR